MIRWRPLAGGFDPGPGADTGLSDPGPGTEVFPTAPPGEPERIVLEIPPQKTQPDRLIAQEPLDLRIPEPPELPPLPVVPPVPPPPELLAPGLFLAAASIDASRVFRPGPILPDLPTVTQTGQPILRAAPWEAYRGHPQEAVARYLREAPRLSPADQAGLWRDLQARGLVPQTLRPVVRAVGRRPLLG